jgi:aminopeptidase N
MESVDREAHKGKDEYEHGLLGELGNYVAEARGRYRRPVVCQDYELPIDLFDRHLYEKGGLVLHLLRTEIGDAAFWAGVRQYLTRHAHGVVETRDLQRALEDASGRSLERFFEQWLHRPGHPELTVKASWEGGALTIDVKQGQSTQPMPALAGEALAVPHFAFDLTVDVLDEHGAATRHVLEVERGSHGFAIGAPARPAGLVIDAELRVLGEVNADLPGDWLRFALRRAPTARGRVLAAQALARRNEPLTAVALREALLDEDEFWGVRAEAASTLGELRTDEAFRALEEATRVLHPKARRAVASALGKFRTAASAAALEPLALSDRSYLVEAAAARALGATRQPRAFDVLVELLERPSWAEVVRCGALDGLAALRDERAVPHLMAKLKYGVPARARRAAILALAQLSQDRKAREALEEQLDDHDPHVLHDVIRALGEIGDARSRPVLSRLLDRDLDGRVRRRTREVLRELLGPPRREVAALRDELETLRKDHADLVARLGKMEARLGPELPSGAIAPLPPKSPRARAAPKAAPTPKKKKSAAKPSRTTPRATSGRDGGPRPHTRGLR